MASGGSRSRSQHTTRPSSTRPGTAGGGLAPGEVIGPGRLDGSGPANLLRGLDGFERGREAARRGLDAERRLVHAPDLAGIGMHVDEALARHRHVQQRVALRRHLAHAGADQQQEVGARQALQQPRVGADADLAGVVRMGGVEEAGPAERGRDRQGEALGETGHGGARPGGPAAAAQHQGGPLGGPEQLLQLRHLGQAGPGQGRLDARRVGDARHLGQDVLGQRDHDRAGSTPAGRRGRRATGSRGCARGRRPPRPIWRCCRRPRGNPSPGRRRGPAWRAPPGPRRGSAARNRARRRGAPPWRCWRRGRASPCRCPGAR